MSLFKQSKQQGGKDGWKLDQNWPCFVLIIMLIFAQGQVAHVFVATPNCTQPPIVAANRRTCHRVGFPLVSSTCSAEEKP